MKQYCVNGYIAVKPFRKDLAVKVNEQARLAGIEQVTTLASSEVVYGNERIPAGATVYMIGEAHKQFNATAVREVEPGKPFVLIQEAVVRVVFLPA